MVSFQKRRKKHGKTVFRARVRLTGHPDQSATFERKTDARCWATAKESEIREGRHFKTSKANQHTLGELIDRYIQSVLPKKSESMQVNQYGQLLWWKERFGEKRLSEMSPAMIAQGRDRLLNEIGFKGKSDLMHLSIVILLQSLMLSPLPYVNGIGWMKTP